MAGTIMWFVMASLTVGGITAEQPVSKEFKSMGECSHHLKSFPKDTKVKYQCIGNYYNKELGSHPVKSKSQPSWMTDEMAAKLIEKRRGISQ